MDGRKTNGGAREGAGRKPKTDELELIESLDKLIDKDQVIKVLHGLVIEGDMKAVKDDLESDISELRTIVLQAIQKGVI